MALNFSSLWVRQKSSKASTPFLERCVSCFVCVDLSIKVAGDTIYNMIKLNELELEPNSDRPVHPPKYACILFIFLQITSIFIDVYSIASFL